MKNSDNTKKIQEIKALIKDLYDAVLSGDSDKAQNLLSSIPAAVRFKILDCDYTPIKSSSQDESFLDFAIRNNNIKMIEVLTNNGASLETESFDESPLFNAVCELKVDVVKALINAGAPLSDESETNLLSVILENLSLEDDLQEKALKIMKLLIDAGIDVNKDNILYFSIAKCSFEIIKLLVDSGANIGTPEDEYYPVAEAMTYNDVEVVDLFIRHGADIEKALMHIENNLVGNRQYSELEYSRETDGYNLFDFYRFNIIKKKISNGKDLTAKENDFKSSTLYNEDLYQGFYEQRAIRKSKYIAKKRLLNQALTNEEKDFTKTSAYYKEYEEENEKHFKLLDLVARKSKLKELPKDITKELSGLLNREDFINLFNALLNKESLEERKVLGKRAADEMENSNSEDLIQAKSQKTSEEEKETYKIIDAMQDPAGNLIEYQEGNAYSSSYTKVKAIKDINGVLTKINPDYHVGRMEVGIYDNIILNHPKIQEILKISHDKGVIEELLSLGEDESIAEALLEEINAQGEVAPVMDILFGQGNIYMPNFSDLQLVPQGIFDSFNGIANRLSESLEEYLSFGEKGFHLDVMLKLIESFTLINSDIPFIKYGGYRGHDDHGDEDPSGFGGGSGSMFTSGDDQENINLPSVTILPNGTMVIEEGSLKINDVALIYSPDDSF